MFAVRLLVLLVVSSASVAQGQPAVQADAAELARWTEAFREIPSSITYRPSPADDADRIRARLEIAARARLLATQAAPFVARFTARYGEDESAIGRAFRGVDRAAAQKFYDLQRRVTRYPAQAAEMAGVCLDLVMEETNPATLQRLQPLFRDRALATAREMLANCEAFAGTEAAHQARIAEARSRVGGLASEVEARRAAAAEAELAALRARTWPAAAQVRPGNARSLARQALSYLRQHSDWGRRDGYTLLTSVVTHDWQVHRRDVRGRPTEYKLGLRIALTRPDTPDGQVDTVEVSLTTHQRQRPPFHDVLVGTWNRMLRERIPD